MNAKVRKLAEELLTLVDSVSDAEMHAEIIRVQSLAIPMSLAIRYGHIDRLTAEGVESLEIALREVRTLVESGTWGLGGDYVSVFVASSGDDADRAGSDVIVIDGWRKVHVTYLNGKHVHGLPLKRAIDATLAELGFESCAYARRTAAGVVFHTRRTSTGT